MTGEPLSLAGLHRLRADHRPLVDPRDLPVRMVHVGLGAFHRAHQAVYTEAASAATGDAWGIAGIAPRSADTVEALRRQDGLFSVCDLAPGDPRVRVVGSVRRALRMVPDAAQVRDLLTAPEVEVVTLTVTEKGYHRATGSARLDTTDPDVAADLAGRREPGTAVGMLAAGLAARCRSGGAPLSVVSCDNMTANGAVTASVVRDFLAASHWADRSAVIEWLDTAVRFPSTVVDRIVPTATAHDVEQVSGLLGLHDAVPVIGEPYRQWVLEDDFAGARPAWENGGARFVDDVTPHQVMKLRLLNGSHSAMAYLGLAAGFGTVAEVAHSRWGERLVRGLCAEVTPTLPGALDVPAYTDALVARFGNVAMGDRLQRIGCDGTLKVAERWIGPLRELVETGADTPVLELALAGWIHATRPGQGGAQVFGTTDPHAASLAALHADSPDPRTLVAGCLALVGAPDLADDPGVVGRVADRLPAVRAGRVELCPRHLLDPRLPRQPGGRSRSPHVSGGSR